MNFINLKCKSMGPVISCVVPYMIVDWGLRGGTPWEAACQKVSPQKLLFPFFHNSIIGLKLF